MAMIVTDRIWSVHPCRRREREGGRERERVCDCCFKIDLFLVWSTLALIGH